MPAERDEQFLQRPSNHHYSFGVIDLFVRLVLDAASTLRGASACLDLVRTFLPHMERVPTATCGQMWLLRIGLHELTREKENADDWIWIVDHTVQIGKVKCLVIVGCHQSQWQQQPRPLEHGDLQLLALQPVEQSDGPTVHKQLEQVAAKTGVPRSIVSDHGADLKRGIEAFQQKHPQTDNVYDIAHKMAILVKRELKSDDHWAQFLKQMAHTKQRLQQTSLAFLVPPSLKNKARYMNLDAVVSWGKKALAYLENPPPVEGVQADIDTLNEKLGWLRNYGKSLAEWADMMHVVGTTLEYVRHHGYHRRARDELREELELVCGDGLGRRMSEQVLWFVAEQSSAAKGDERLIGSSECLESLIGKGKRLEGQQSKSGFTKMILGMAASVVEPTKQYVSGALSAVKTRDVLQWCHENLGVSVQSQRRLAFAAPSKGTKPG